MKAEEARIKISELHMKWVQGKVKTLDELNQKKEAVLESYAKKQAIEFVEYWEHQISGDQIDSKSVEKLYNKWKQ